MTYTWYWLFARAEFESTGLVSRTLTLNLDQIGLKDILITYSQLLGVTYDGVFLALGLNDKNPFEMSGYALYEDERGIWLGIAEAEDA